MRLVGQHDLARLTIQASVEDKASNPLNTLLSFYEANNSLYLFLILTPRASGDHGGYGSYISSEHWTKTVIRSFRITRATDISGGKEKLHNCRLFG